MINFLFQVAANNVCMSLVLAIVAVIVGKTLKRPVLTHLLWLLVFLKLLIPPVIMISPIPILLINKTAPIVKLNINEQQKMLTPMGNEDKHITYSSPELKSVLFNHGKRLLFLLWLSGSMVIFFWSIYQAFRFHQLLKKESETAPPKIQAIAAKAASYLGLKAAPVIRTTSANISPMVWWAGGKLWLVIPAALIEQMDEGQLQLILSHELAHISRWDYLCRWIEWMACVCFWWNPVVWWARHNLRVNEEICCDELVLSSMKPEPYIYGDTLVKAIDILLCTPRFQVAMASNFNGGDLLKRRLKLIISKNQSKSKLRWLNACILLAAVVLLPFGLMQAKGRNVNKLEYQLNTVEKELEKASEQLSEELSQKAKYKKAYDQYSKNTKKDPVLQILISDGLKQTLVKNYFPLFNKLTISKEEFEELKDILLDQQEEIRAIKPSNSLTATDEENMKIQQQRKDIRDKYDKVISESLEKENFHIYSSYQKSLPERSGLNQFMERILSDNKISEEETEILIDSMHAARKAVFNKMGPDINMNLSSNLTEENIALQSDKIKLVFDKYVEASRSILPEEQVEQYKIFLKGNLDMNKASMKRRLYMKNK